MPKPLRKNKVTFGLHSLHSEESKEHFKNQSPENSASEGEKILAFNETAEFGELDTEEQEKTDEEEDMN